MSKNLCMVRDCSNNDGLGTCNIGAGLDGFSTLDDAERAGMDKFVHHVGDDCELYQMDTEE